MTRSSGMSKVGSYTLMDQYRTAIRTSRGVARIDMVFLALERALLSVKSAASPSKNVIQDRERPTTVGSWKYHPKEFEYIDSHVVRR